MTADWMTDWHETLFDVIVVFSVIHIAAIAFYWFAKRNNLVTPMVTGKRVIQDENTAGIERPKPLRIAVCVALAAALSIWVQLGAPLA